MSTSTLSKPKINLKTGTVQMSHGSGGKAMQQLIEQLFIRNFSNEFLLEKNDQARFDVPNKKLVMSTDSHVVTPLFFPGGDIGSLSVNGTVNDLAMAGAEPLYLAASFILEEGFLMADLEKIVCSMAEAAVRAGVAIITGDTKVVEKGKGDGVFITTTGIGIVPDYALLSNQIKPGNKIIVSGYIGDHGITILSKRENLQFYANLCSDTAALHELTKTMLLAVPNICLMRDPTRGGVAAVLNEWSNQYKVGCYIEENTIPIRATVQSACELLGIDPLYVANEGKLLAVCEAKDANVLLDTMKKHPLGKESAIIGEIIEDEDCFVQMHTSFGGMRIIDWHSGEQLPRIC